MMLSTAYSQWESLPPLPEPNGGCVCAHRDGKIVILGGTNWEGGKKNWLKMQHEFDPVQKTWTMINDLSEPVAYAVVLQNEKRFTHVGGFNGEKARYLKHGVLAVGGIVAGREIMIGGTDDPANLAGLSKETWALGKGDERLADYPDKPFAVAASAVVGGELFVFGGMNYDKNTQLPLNTDVAYAFSPKKNTWRPLKGLPRANRGLSAVTLDERQIYIAGGYTDDFTADAVIYDVMTDSYRKAESLPYAAMVGLVKLDGFVYCIGGEDKKQSRTDKFFRLSVAEVLK
jgi:N-acetylneuraminic acid mutarotase